MTASAQPPAGDDGVASAAEVNVFALELRRWRDVRGLSRTALAKLMSYDRSYVSKVASGTEPPSKDFALRAETVLKAGGALWAAFREYEATRTRPTRQPGALQPAPQRESAHLG
jgi:transcriptional regulator with XRE-family HTH domain